MAHNTHDPFASPLKSRRKRSTSGVIVEPRKRVSRSHDIGQPEDFFPQLPAVRREREKKKRLKVSSSKSCEDRPPPQAFDRSIGMIISEQAELVKVLVHQPFDFTIWILLPSDSIMTVKAVITQIIRRLKLNSPKPDSLDFYNDYSLMIDDKILEPNELLSSKLRGDTPLTFQRTESPREIIMQSQRRVIRALKRFSIGSLNIDRPAESPRTKFRDIQPIRKIARGATATVKSCYVDNMICAMKEIETINMNEGPHISEIAVFENLQPHPNIIRYLFHQKKERKVQIFMKQYKETLRDVILSRSDSNSPFTPDEIINILIDIATGMSYLHTNHFIHRDLKSENIFVDERENKTTYAIGDFDTAITQSLASKPGSIVGTPAFIAPEILTSGEQTIYTRKADVFSFGMIIYELLSLKLPYYQLEKSWEVSEAIVEHCELPLLPPLSEEYNDILDLYYKCLELSPSQRPKSRRVLSFLKDIKLKSNSSVYFNSP